jgi:hypothetical protein
MTRARRLQCEQRELEIERAGVLARRYFYLLRLTRLKRQAAKHRTWMWFYLLVQAELSHERTVQ